MKMKMCLVSKKDAQNGLNIGYDYIMKHKSELIEVNDQLHDSIITGYTIGTLYMVYQNKVYWVVKSYVLTEENITVLVCKESEKGCDITNE